MHFISKANKGKSRIQLSDSRVEQFRSQIACFLKNYSVVIIGVGVTRFLAFLTSVILARKLGVEEFGAFSIAYTVMMLVAQFPSVLDSSFVRFYSSTDNMTEKRDVLQATLYMKAAVAGVMILIGILLSGFMATNIFKKEDLNYLIILGILAGAFLSIFTTLLAYFQGRSKFISYSTVYSVQSLMILSAILFYSTLASLDADGSMYIYVSALGISSSLASGFLLRKTGLLPHNSILIHVRKLFHFSKWLLLAQLLFIVLQRVDILLLTRYANYELVGLYAAAARISVVFTLFIGSLPLIFLPQASRAIESWSALRSYLVQGIAAIVGILILLGVGISLAPQLLQLAFGQQYVRSVVPLRILLAGYAFVAIYSPIVPLIYGVGKVKLIFLQRLIELTVAVTVGLLLIRQLSWIGVALALALAYFIGCVFILFSTYYYVRKHFSG